MGKKKFALFAKWMKKRLHALQNKRRKLCKVFYIAKFFTLAKFSKTLNKLLQTFFRRLANFFTRLANFFFYLANISSHFAKFCAMQDAMNDAISLTLLFQKIGSLFRSFLVQKD